MFKSDCRLARISILQWIALKCSWSMLGSCWKTTLVTRRCWRRRRTRSPCRPWESSAKLTWRSFSPSTCSPKSANQASRSTTRKPTRSWDQTWWRYWPGLKQTFTAWPSCSDSDSDPKTPTITGFMRTTSKPYWRTTPTPPVTTGNCFCWRKSWGRFMATLTPRTGRPNFNSCWGKWETKPNENVWWKRSWKYFSEETRCSLGKNRAT